MFLTTIPTTGRSELLYLIKKLCSSIKSCSVYGQQFPQLEQNHTTLKWTTIVYEILYTNQEERC